MSIQARHPAGVPAGGRFAPQSHAEVDISLTDPAPAVVASDPAVDALLDEWVDLKAAQERVDAQASIGRPASANELMVLNGRLSALLDRCVEHLSGGRPADDSPGPVAVSGADFDDLPGEVREALREGAAVTGDDFVQGGGTADQVVHFDQFGDPTVFSRRREGVYGRWPQRIRLQANRPLTDAEMRHAAGLAGYAYRAGVRGESLGDPERDSPYSFIVYADTTKTRRDDLGEALDDFERSLPEMVREGSPVRKTDRSGPGTKGTRLVDGFGDRDLAFEIYYDDVEVVGQS